MCQYGHTRECLGCRCLCTLTHIFTGLWSGGFHIFHLKSHCHNQMLWHPSCLWEMTWRVFHTIILLHPDKVSKMTMAAVCLHNIHRDCRLEACVPLGLADREDEDHRFVEGDWRREELGPLQSLQGARG